ncbi:DUF1145 domain-containing protein [Colwellia sp. 6M3]|jgi:uncharacterized protein YhhL (DUF1145 family)|uniref:DUF1145 domain-containing protein n=1 Tax=Colwellia sp. 6M3 TaxID=2759849 RepID=UPI0015F6825C|nr:DUF1145 domain-containing protein [Colwellia sp. 6M3]MBA6415827.1 DUF1145 domain-containing protein [Colwellia sp. 6M3]|tara:strand:+ start:3644 stop:3916 length:273 start_codon:yes stop_codon:yes gene_type:complete
MFNVVVFSLKALLTGLWIFAILGLLSLSPLPTEVQFYVSLLACITLLVHFVEFFAMKTKFKSQSGLAMNFGQTMLWGFGYWLPILNSSAK